jgi:hypothetical protein
VVELTVADLCMCVVTWTVTRRVRKALLATKEFDGISLDGGWNSKDEERKYVWLY